MRDRLTKTPLPSNATAVADALRETFFSLVGHSVDSPVECIRVDRYPKLGMSGGQVSPGFWRATAIPELVRRASAE